MAQQLIRRALVRAAGNKTEAANLLGIRRQQLYAKLNELGIDQPATVTLLAAST